MRCALLLLLALLAGGPARAGLTAEELATVGAAPGEGAAVPADLGLTGAGLPGGAAPTVLVLADLTCPDICDPLVAQTAQALGGTGLAPGRDYRLTVLGIDPRDGPAERAAFLDDAVKGDARAALLSPDLSPADLARVTGALGFTTAYDEESERFAHPAVAYVLTPSGEVSRVFPAFYPSPADMRLALVEAGQGRVGGVIERLILTCYGFDPVTGRYTLAIERAIRLASLIFALVVGVAILVALRRERRAGGGGRAP